MTRPAQEPSDTPAAAEPHAERPPELTQTADLVVPLELAAIASREPERTSTLETLVALPIERRPFVVAMSGPREGALFALPPGGSLVIGRSEACEITLQDEGISRMHARITSVTGGRFVLEDLGSRNGTFVGNSRVTKRMLVADDLIRVGSYTSLRFCLLDAVEQDFQRRLATAAIRDPLTGSFNRRHFDERLATEVGLAKRHERPLSLVLFDVDDFKSVNDRFGHPAGDEVLKAIAAALDRNGRREDEVFRYGGEEFALLARETSREGAVLLTERRLATIRAVKVTIADGRVLTARASAGIATLTGDMTGADLVDKADAALYAAKRSGKDRACIGV